VWGLDNLLQPQDVLELNNKGKGTASSPVAVTALAFPEGEVSQFFVGSEEGAVYQATRHGRFKTNEKN
jgi:dynein intermediate chain